MPTDQLAEGTTLNDTYRVVGLIGKGGMGEVYEVRHARLAGRYALKLLVAEAEKDSEAFLRFRREAQIVSGLRHPHIVQVIDFDHAPDGRPYLVMELLDGDHLEALLRRVGPLPPRRVAAIVKQIASGLAAAHAHGVVHRDLKPENVLLSSVAGEQGDFIKIVDFGVSKVKNASLRVTQGRRLLGTPQYMSPEQIRSTELDERTDQFALASITYELLTGDMAFTGHDHAAVVYQVVHGEPPLLADPEGWVSPTFDAVLRRALAKDPTRRYPTIAAFATALEEAAAALDDARVPASRPSVLPASSTTLVDRAPPRLRLAAALVLAAAVLTGAWLLFRRPSNLAPTTAATAATPQTTRAPATPTAIARVPTPTPASTPPPPPPAPTADAAIATTPPGPPAPVTVTGTKASTRRRDPRPRPPRHERQLYNEL